MGLGTPIPSALVLWREGMSRFSLQPSSPMEIESEFLYQTPGWIDRVLTIYRAERRAQRVLWEICYSCRRTGMDWETSIPGEFSWWQREGMDGGLNTWGLSLSTVKYVQKCMDGIMDCRLSRHHLSPCHSGPPVRRSKSKYRGRVVECMQLYLSWFESQNCSYGRGHCQGRHVGKHILPRTTNLSVIHLIVNKLRNNCKGTSNPS